MSKLLVFDLDDCLAPTHAANEIAHTQVYPPAFGLTPEQLMPIQEKIYKSTGCTVTHFAEQMGKDAVWIDDVYAKVARIGQQHFKEKVPVCPEKPALLQQLVNNGWTLAIITQAVRQHALNVLQHLNLKEFFPDHLILGRGDTPGFTKRTPEPFLEVQRRISFTPDVKIMLEDSFINLKAPRALDFKTGLVTPHLRDDADWLTYQAHDVKEIIKGILQDYPLSRP